MNKEDIPTELELAAMLKVLMSLPKKEVENLVRRIVARMRASQDRSYTTAPKLATGAGLLQRRHQQFIY